MKRRIFSESVRLLITRCILKAGNINKLSKNTGISRVTLYRLLEGKPYNISTKSKLEGYYYGNRED